MLVAPGQCLGKRHAEAMLRDTKGYPYVSDGIRSFAIGLEALYHHFPCCATESLESKRIPENLANPDAVAESHLSARLQPKSAWSNGIEARPCTEMWTC